MSENNIANILTAIITALGSIIGGFLGAYATIIAAKIKEEKKENQVLPEKSTKDTSWKGVFTGTLIGAVLTLIVLSALGWFSFSKENFPPTNETSEGSVLFSDDFEDGNSDGWDVASGTWEVIQDATGNYVYSGKGNNWGLVTTGSEKWENYILEFKSKGVESLQQSGANDFMAASVRVNLGATTCQRYVAHLHFGSGGSLQLGKYGNSCSKDWNVRPYQIKLGEWYYVRLEVFGNTLKLYINDKLMSVNTDDELTAGYIGLSLGQDDVAYFDDVRVTEITK
jgi:hypothetical protein